MIELTSWKGLNVSDDDWLSEVGVKQADGDEGCRIRATCQEGEKQRDVQYQQSLIDDM